MSIQSVSSALPAQPEGLVAYRLLTPDEAALLLGAGRAQSRSAAAFDTGASLQSYQRRDVQGRSKDREVTTEDPMAVLATIEAWMTRKRPGPRPTTVYRDLVLLIAGTACRPGEALALRRGDIDLNFPVAPGTTKAVAHITGTVVYDEELGGLYRQPHTKSNGAGDRT